MAENNIPLSLYCYAMNKFVAMQHELSISLEQCSNAQGKECTIFMETMDHLQPQFLFYVSVKELADKYESEPIDLMLSINICLNHRSGNFEIEIFDKEYKTFKSPITSSTAGFMEIFDKAVKMFDEKVNALFDRIDNWESGVASADRQREMDIELKIHESRLENNYDYTLDRNYIFKT